jgi:hypothetical protein
MKTSSKFKQLKSFFENPHLPDRLKRFMELQMLLILIIILFGDSFKFGNMFGLTSYNWIQGHFSDLGLTAQFTTAFYYLYGHKSIGPYFAVIIPPILFTLYELWQYPNTDPADIVCYCIGSLAALTSIRIYKIRLKRNGKK